MRFSNRPISPCTRQRQQGAIKSTSSHPLCKPLSMPAPRRKTILAGGIGAKQFLLYFQPQMDSRHLTAAEALLRWNHPRRGIVFPVEFIPLAEETGLILSFGNWALESACRQVATWAHNEKTAHLTVSVNISVRQMRHPSFVEQVLATLEQTGANPRKLRLELTESMFVDSFGDDRQNDRTKGTGP